MKEYVYPLGSVVLAKEPNGEEVKILIAAYGIRDKKNSISYEYAGFEIPGGFDPNKICYLNNNNIICPIFIGSIDSNNKKIRKEVSKHYDNEMLPLLPVGSIVEIADGKRVMITGLCMMDLKKDKVFDYLAEDLVNRLSYRFNKEDVKDIIFVGFSDAKFLAYRSFLEDMSKNISDTGNLYNEIKKYMLKVGE